MPHNESQSVSRMKENFTSGLTGRGWKPTYDLVNKSLRNRKSGATGYQVYEARHQSFTLLALLAEIVTNTLNTMMELQKQSELMNDEMRGINDRINRIRTIAEVVQPSEWDKWKDPREALNRLRIVYHTIPKEYRSEKYDQIENELAKAMNLVARVGPETATTFNSGKELERRGADASPGVAQKLTASGVGTLIALESQSQVIQSHITSLLAQMLAEGNERETRSVATRGSSFKSFSVNLSQKESQFSDVVLKKGLN